MKRIITAYRVYTFHRNIALGVAGIMCMSLLALVAPVGASDDSVVTVYADGQKHVITTDASTVGEVLDRTEVRVGPADLVEPSRDTEITSQTFNVNVYRARPVVIDDADRDETYRTRTAYQSPRLIAQNADEIKVHEKDKFEFRVVTDFVNSDFIGHKVVIDRATPVNVALVNRDTVVRTHASTVDAMLKEADIEVNENDRVEPGRDKRIKKNMDVSITRIGYKTITKEETIQPPTETIHNNDRPIGYKKVKEQGEPGVALTTYKVKYRNGEVASRERIRRVVDEKPEARIIIVGSKNNFDGNIWAELRFCESGGDYSRVSDPVTTSDGSTIRYYGAYQFHPGTWDRYNTGYETADQAPPEVQDRVARENVMASQGGFYSQHPGCAEKLGLPQFP